MFLDARHIYRQVDRAHRDWTRAQVDFLASIVRLYRGERVDLGSCGDKVRAMLQMHFGKKPAYGDVAGLCNTTTTSELKAQGWSLNPGRYVGVAPGDEVDDQDFKERLQLLSEDFEKLTVEARELESRIAAAMTAVLDA